jgi:hypothetical protein
VLRSPGPAHGSPELVKPTPLAEVDIAVATVGSAVDRLGGIPDWLLTSEGGSVRAHRLRQWNTIIPYVAVAATAAATATGPVLLLPPRRRRRRRSW